MGKGYRFIAPIVEEAAAQVTTLEPSSSRPPGDKTASAPPGSGKLWVTILALASTGGTPVANIAGNGTKVPPPATAFSVPAITAAKNKEMAWLTLQRVILAVQFEVGGLELAPICAG